MRLFRAPVVLRREIGTAAGIRTPFNGVKIRFPKPIRRQRHNKFSSLTKKPRAFGPGLRQQEIRPGRYALVSSLSLLFFIITLNMATSPCQSLHIIPHDSFKSSRIFNFTFPAS